MRAVVIWCCSQQYNTTHLLTHQHDEKLAINPGDLDTGYLGWPSTRCSHWVGDLLAVWSSETPSLSIAEVQQDEIRSLLT